MNIKMIESTTDNLTSVNTSVPQSDLVRYTLPWSRV